MNKLVWLIGLVMFAGLQAPAAASTVSFQSVLDLNTSGFLSDHLFLTFAYFGGYSGFVPAQVTVGDDVHIKYTFADGLGISASSVTGVDQFVIDFDRNTGSTADGTPYEQISTPGTLQLLGADGHAIAAFAATAGGACCIVLGGFSFSGAATGPLTIYGVVFDGTVMSADPDVARIYNRPMLDIAGSDLAIAPAAAPIPGSLSLFLSALGSLGLTGWRYRKSASSV